MLMRWFYDVFRAWRREFKLAFHDEGVLVFFFALVATYPFLYALIYNTEVARNEPMVVVDNSRTALSRELVREMNATPEVNVIGYAANMEEAREAMSTKKAYCIMLIPSDFSDKANGGQRGHVSMYVDMSILMRYKAYLVASTNVISNLNGERQAQKVAVFNYQTGSIIESEQVPLGNTGMGLASALLPSIFIFVLHQGMVLGIAMLYAGSLERRRRHRGLDPWHVPTSASAHIIGRTLCHWVIYIIPTIVALYYAGRFFDFPENASPLDVTLFALPFLLAVSMFAQCIQVFLHDRESVFFTFVFTSVAYVFVSGISWPLSSMSPLYRFMGYFIPGTFASHGYVMMSTCGATLSQVIHDYHCLWIQCGCYFVMAFLLEKYVSRPRYRWMEAACNYDPDFIEKRELHINGGDVVESASDALSEIREMRDRQLADFQLTQATKNQ